MILDSNNKPYLVRRFVSFDLDPEKQKLRQKCRDFANDSLKTTARNLDHEQRYIHSTPYIYLQYNYFKIPLRFPVQHITEIAKLGLMGIGVSKENNGSGLGMLSTCLAVEELSRGCASTGIIVSIHNCLYANLLQRRGTDWQKNEFLVPFTKGQIGAFALSEHGK